MIEKNVVIVEVKQFWGNISAAIQIFFSFSSLGTRFFNDQMPPQRGYAQCDSGRLWTSREDLRGTRGSFTIQQTSEIYGLWTLCSCRALPSGSKTPRWRRSSSEDRRVAGIQPGFWRKSRVHLVDQHGSSVPKWKFRWSQRVCTDIRIRDEAFEVGRRLAFENSKANGNRSPIVIWCI